ncbi:class A beta-lactamase-related serine hydrolase [Streptomyces ipomoeae]|nr:class A beta-lactamase-related serine hydrolase [Streptomyces ipomoeae]TQE38519.1 class A beta-lactamase-related serine hydrolase [Streptomyces ipomoeae]
MAVTAATAAMAPAVGTAGPAAAAPADRDHGNDANHREHGATRQAVEAAVADGVPGVIAQAKDKRGGVWKTAAGVGNLDTGAPRTPKDRFRVGSITKTFVATVVLQLEAEGKLSLDDTVEKWLPGLVTGNGHDGDAIIVRQLLNHTSGIFNSTEDSGFLDTYYFADGFLRHRYDTVTPEQLVAIAMKHEPYFAPGTGWHYSNTNYVLAGLIIEKATGNPYGDEVRARIVEPLGLRSTTVPGTDPTMPSPSGRAYSKLALTADGPTYDVTEFNPSIPYAAGEIISTTADLNRFVTALVRGDLLPPKQQSELTTTVEATGYPDERYGLGITDVELSCGIHVWGHSGDVPGSHSDMATTPDGRHSLAFNFNGDWAGDAEAVIEAEFCGEGAEQGNGGAGGEGEPGEQGNRAI